MGAETMVDYSIVVDRTVRQVLDLLTRRRWYATLTVGKELSEEQEEHIRGEGLAWLEICGSEESNGIGLPEWRCRCPRWRYLLIGDPLDSRDGGTFFGVPIAFPPIGSLYEFCEGKALRFVVKARTEAEANRIWLREMLRLGADPGKWYRCDDSSSITVSLRRVSTDSDCVDAVRGAAGTKPAPVDIAEFEVYDRLYGKLQRMAEDYCYGDDIFVEYSISSDEGVARYCATEFYSNHNWSADPANLFVMRFCGEAASEGCARKDVQFSHPTKATERRAGHERFLVDSLTMANDVEVKFFSCRGDERKPDETVSADRVLDNLVDFDMWVDMYRKEVQLD